MFESYKKFIKHDRSFNTFFVTTATALAAIVIAWIMISARFFTNQNSWIAAIVLAALPVIAYIAMSGESEFHSAYYKTWRDYLTGVNDRKKILENFARKYNIGNWRKKVEDIEVDGRWHFHADTRYMHELAHQRDLLLSRIEDDYKDSISKVDKQIADSKTLLQNATLDHKMAVTNVATTKRRLEKAEELFKKSSEYSSEVYQQRCELSRREQIEKQADKNINNQRCEQEKLEKEKVAITKNFEDVVYRVRKIYYSRYSKYTELAVKRINKVNGLKYTVVDMPDIT